MGRIVDVAYELPVPEPVFPCALVHLPTVELYHLDYAREITRLAVEVDVLIGRGDVVDAIDQLGEYLSTDTTRSVLLALEDDLQDEDPWYRLAVLTTSPLNDIGDSVGVTFNIEIDA